MVEKTVVMCGVCGRSITPAANSSGHGIDGNGAAVCYACCAELDKAQMRETGKAILYLTMLQYGDRTFPPRASFVSNWPGSLRIDCTSITRGRHNIAGVRYDVWFVFEGYYWHGITYGDNTQLCHCRKTKQMVSPEINKRHYIGHAGLHGYMPNYSTWGYTRGDVAEVLGELHELSGRKIAQLRRDCTLELDLYEHGNEYCEIVECDCGDDPEKHHNELYG